MASEGVTGVFSGILEGRRCATEGDFVGISESFRGVVGVLLGVQEVHRCNTEDPKGFHMVFGGISGSFR